MLILMTLALTLLQDTSPVGTYHLTFQPRTEVMTATLVIAKRDSTGYRATVTMRQLGGSVSSDSVEVHGDRVRVYAPSNVADITFEFGIAKPNDDKFLVHFDDGDLRGKLQVDRPGQKQHSAKPNGPVS